MASKDNKKHGRRYLTKRQLVFCEHYLLTQKPKESAIKAGYPEKTAGTYAWRLMQMPKVKEYIELKLNQLAARNNITQERVLQEIAAVAFADHRSLLQKGFDTDKYTPEEAAALQIEIERGPNGPKQKIKMADKVNALDKLAKIFKLYPEKNVTVQNAVVIPGMKELLNGINGADTGIGPASSRIARSEDSGQEVAIRESIQDKG